MSAQITEPELNLLEQKIDALIERCNQLEIVNQSLKTKQEELVRDRAQLLEKTAIAKNRVEAMITRLKSMGHNV